MSISCNEVREQLALSDRPVLALVERHLLDCPDCVAFKGFMARVDSVLPAVLVAPPPGALQGRLMAIAESFLVEGSAARAPEHLDLAPSHWWTVFLGFLAALRPHPRMVLAQLVASIAVLAAGWRLVTWSADFVPIVGAVGSTVQAISTAWLPPLLNLPGGDLSSFVLWGAVGIIAWAVSERGPVTGLLDQFTSHELV